MLYAQRCRCSNGYSFLAVHRAPGVRLRPGHSLPVTKRAGFSRPCPMSSWRAPVARQCGWLTRLNVSKGEAVHEGERKRKYPPVIVLPQPSSCDHGHPTQSSEGIHRQPPEKCECRPTCPRPQDVGKNHTRRPQPVVVRAGERRRARGVRTGANERESISR